MLKHERVVSKNRAANALRMAASTLRESDSYLGARFRSLRARLGEQRAIKAMAAYLARLIYRMLTKGQEWVDRGTQDFEKRHQARLERTLKCLATKMGFHLVPAA